MIESFILYLQEQDKSSNTVKSYKKHVEDYILWFTTSFSAAFKKIYRENIIDYKSYLINIRKLNAKSINAILAAIQKFNEFLIEKKFQDEQVIFKKDYLKVQTEYASPAIVSKVDIESFRQKILESGSKRNYALITLLAYSGMRISEATNLKISDVNLMAKEILVRYGKGKKQRLVIVNDKIVNAIKEYLKVRQIHKYKDSEYLFVSRESEKVDNTVINRLFNKYSEKITPHTLRHFFCSYALENGLSVHEVANQAGHSNIHTTLIYTNPSREEMKRKINLL
ncbi:tyrosine-type recombinase/integrase [Pseudobacteroides cellulosolvens]|uniref:Integrase family protein n=1 Tax=Pseudobacteroides cellulosolvens ATCC 35603 = DSM 2933 TaxID=398512 RepID=A0A0L6JX24_9FIRM|nr:tyrosine-type recombinase/integrase [Pseudobacteroides cellulosolvens]KNY30150.1 integrase family protein [Pseudobacteroides cellulosolvens ATCC 35603 = DSM 2933]